MDGLSWKTLLKWMIWGYHHHFRKPPYVEDLKLLILEVNKVNGPKPFGYRTQTTFWAPDLLDTFFHSLYSFSKKHAI